MTPEVEVDELFPEVENLYAHLSVHRGMLFDEKRMEKYSEAIRCVVKKGDTVADIGTGLGILAFLALDAGAGHIYAIEQNPTAIRWAKQVATHNGFEKAITFFQENSCQVELPQKVDIIVSELIGHIAFEEGIIKSLIDARNRFLAPGGKIIPRSVQLKAALVEEKDVFPNYINMWRDLLERAKSSTSPTPSDLQVLLTDAFFEGDLMGRLPKHCYLKTFKAEEIMSQPQTLFSVNFEEGEAPYSLKTSLAFIPSRGGEINGVALWFDAELVPEVTLSTSPLSTYTHWKQCYAPIVDSIPADGNTLLLVNLQLKPGEIFPLSLEIERG
ncbi:MAG: hypothetical protein UU32_C0040G0007 [Candidatus Woesebacteria bacterium GW2011_GWB1_41_10]|uniref:Protein arginine N-methyltransferase domain-containing protein n=2 Tax=Microgenomates group TaxID=1794810 RepID=A0A0G0R5B6_9BACT|nr:MAG: hypothetical protein UT84_C0052G0007 [Candidatus Curtissbacteria bacterium GW2011_GWA1_40_16]KKR85104.1 MAG: hypothetical protein UU32_C0040G0007 [Candidatus Woesebacteria bacterium GW2011_GWB1_41_10]